MKFSGTSSCSGPLQMSGGTSKLQQISCHLHKPRTCQADTSDTRCVVLGLDKGEGWLAVGRAWGTVGGA